jgi:large subunit ribosomal protein L30
VTPRSSGAKDEGATPGNLRVTQVRSGISEKPKHRGTLRALGLRGVGKVNILPDRAEIRGMLARVPHLVTVEPATAQEAASRKERSDASRRAHRAAEKSLSSDVEEQS